jgi:hypothetical protein
MLPGALHSLVESQDKARYWLPDEPSPVPVINSNRVDDRILYRNLELTAYTQSTSTAALYFETLTALGRGTTTCHSSDGLSPCQRNVRDPEKYQVKLRFLTTGWSM